MEGMKNHTDIVPEAGLIARVEALPEADRRLNHVTINRYRHTDGRTLSVKVLNGRQSLDDCSRIAFAHFGNGNFMSY
jgi:hypothetical protein